MEKVVFKAVRESYVRGSDFPKWRFCLDQIFLIGKFAPLFH